MKTFSIEQIAVDLLKSNNQRSNNKGIGYSLRNKVPFYNTPDPFLPIQLDAKTNLYPTKTVHLWEKLVFHLIFEMVLMQGYLSS